MQPNKNLARFGAKKKINRQTWSNQSVSPTGSLIRDGATQIAAVDVRGRLMFSSTPARSAGLVLRFSLLLSLSLSISLSLSHTRTHTLAPLLPPQVFFRVCVIGKVSVWTRWWARNSKQKKKRTGEPASQPSEGGGGGKRKNPVEMEISKKLAASRRRLFFSSFIFIYFCFSSSHFFLSLFFSLPRWTSLLPAPSLSLQKTRLFPV